MLPESVIFLAAFIHICATATYVYSTLRGQTQPNRVTWFMWALAPMIATAAQRAGGIGISTLMVFLSGFGLLVIFICSFFNKKAYWKTSRFDYICGVLALCGLALWYVEKNQDLAIIFSILSDFLAAIPTLRKAYFNPESENRVTYLMALIACIIGIFCVQQNNFTGYGFISYLILMYLSVSVILFRKSFLGFLKWRRVI
jgi:hypothetical protein